MDAKKSSIHEIIQANNQQYMVPLFQRAYSWEKKQWQELWNDIKDLCEPDHHRPHFMGSLVTIPHKLFPDGLNKFLLIDGQQRLTTIFIILAVIRDQAKKDETTKELGDEIQETILVNKYKKELEYYKLLPTQNDREDFFQIIKNEQKTNNSSINECYKFFDKEIQGSKLDLKRIKDIICSKLSVVSVTLDKDDDPHLVFESLNAKGKDLTQADLIRNYFFMRIDANEQNSVYEKYWLPMQELLGDNLTEFIRHYLTKSGLFVKQNEVYFTLKNKIDDKDVLSELKDLCKFAEYYANFLDPEKEKNPKIRKYLQRIDRLDIGTVYPFLLNCYDDWKENKITESDMINIFQIIENFVIRRFVCKIQTSQLNKVFASLYARVSKDINLDYKNFIDRLKFNLSTQNYPKDEKFKEDLINVSLYGGNRTEKGKLILESIEESFNHKEQVQFDKLSIEHIMPQKLDDWWKKHLGDEWEKIQGLLIHSLGNLTLIASEYNQELSNHDFQTKKSILQKSHVELNRYFLNKTSWKREDIEKRTDILADICVKIWGDFGEQSIKPKSGKTKGTRPKKLLFLGNEYSVKSSRDVLEKTMNIIADLYPDEFEQIIQKFPYFVSMNTKKFKDNRKLKNNAFINVNLNAKDIQSFCIKAIELTEISSDEWSVEYE